MGSAGDLPICRDPMVGGWGEPRCAALAPGATQPPRDRCGAMPLHACGTVARHSAGQVCNADQGLGAPRTPPWLGRQRGGARGPLERHVDPQGRPPQCTSGATCGEVAQGHSERVHASFLRALLCSTCVPAGNCSRDSAGTKSHESRADCSAAGRGQPPPTPPPQEERLGIFRAATLSPLRTTGRTRSCACAAPTGRLSAETASGE